jgi:hypothetical protein
VISRSVDWESVELRYRAGSESLRTTAAAFGITEGAIRQRAKRENWARDLEARVRQATDAALLRKAATHDVRTEREVVAVEAEMRSEIVVRHRKDIQRGRSLSMTMLGELEVMTEAPMLIRDLQSCLAQCQAGEDIPHAILAKADTLLGQALTLDNRAGVLKTLTDTLTKLVALEREAFGLDKQDIEMDDPLTSLLRNLKARTVPIVHDDPDLRS